MIGSTLTGLALSARLVLRNEAHVIVSMTFDVSLKEWDRLGILEREIRVYKELQSRGFRVTLLTFGDASDLSYQGRCGGIKIVPIYKNRARPETLFFRLLHSMLIPFFFWTLFRSGTVYRSHQLWGSWILFVPRILFRQPLIIRSGYELVLASRDAGASRARILWLSLFSRVALWLADYVVVSSHRMARHFAENFGVNKLKIRTISNSVDITTFCPSEDVGQSGRILFVGRLEPIKNIGLLLKAAKISQVGADIIGSGSEYDALQEFADATNLDCRFLGNIPNEALVSFYRQCLAFVLPSFSEWAPKALFEAMAVGAPVIGTNAPGIKEWIDHRRTGIIVSNDPDDLAQAILQIEQDHTMARNLGQRARTKIASTIGIDSVIREEIALLDEITSGGDFLKFGT